MGPYDDPEYGPGYWEPEGQDAVDEAFAEGAASRDAEVSTLLEEREEYEREIAGLKAEVERLTRLLCAVGAVAAATRAERDRIAWLAEGMANKLHTMDADTVAGCLADLVAYLRSDK